MGREISKRYSFLFDGKGIGRAFSFLYDVQRTGKARELSSFVIWELLHRSRLFPRAAYVRFNRAEVLALQDENPISHEFDGRLRSVLRSQGFDATRLGPNWKFLFVAANGKTWGAMYPDDRELYRSDDSGKSAAFVCRFPHRIKATFVSSRGIIFVCTKGRVYRSLDGGAHFESCLDLGSSESFFRFSNSMTETPAGVLVIGEYGNVWEDGHWRNLANLYYSLDGGATWQRSDFLARAGANKHVHVVKYSALLNRLMVADGDNHKRLWLSEPVKEVVPDDTGWTLANRLHIQMGGYTSLTETANKIFLGTDYQGGTNFIVATTDGTRFAKSVIPDPYRRSRVENLVQRRSTSGSEIWAHLAGSTFRTTCLIMYSRDEGNTWNRVIEHDGSAYTASLIHSSSETLPVLYLAIQKSSSGERAVYRIMDSLDTLRPI